MKAKISLAVLAALVSACSSYKVHYEHSSSPFRGFPTGKEGAEWTLDQVQACGKRRHGYMYGEACAGYVLVSDQYDPWTTTFRFGFEFGGDND